MDPIARGQISVVVAILLHLRMVTKLHRSFSSSPGTKEMLPGSVSSAKVATSAPRCLAFTFKVVRYVYWLLVVSRSQ
jgi:hypothetical protein